MEDILRRLQFRDRTLKQQGISKLVELIIVKHKNSGIIDRSTVETPELSLLFEKCGDSDVIVCDSACTGLLSLVQRGCIVTDFVLRRIVNQAALARSLSGIISLVTEILMSHLESDNDSPYKCPFSIHERPHPYVTLLKTRPDCWRLLIDNIRLQLAICKPQSCEKLILMIEPFIKFIIMDPSSGNARLMKCVAVTSLLHTVSTSGECFERLFSLILNSVALMQMNSVEGLDDVVCMMDSLGHQLMIHSSDVTHDMNIADVYVQQALSLVQTLLTYGLDPSELMQLTLKVVTTFNKVVDRCKLVLQCVDLLTILPELYLIYCLKLADMSVQEDDGGVLNGLLVSMLTLPTLKILTSADQNTGKHSALISHLAASLLSAIDSYQNLSEKERPTECVPAAQDSLKDLLSHPLALGSSFPSFVFLTKYLSSHGGGSSAVTKLWLRNLTSSLQSMTDQAVPNLLVSLCAGLLIDAHCADSAVYSLNALTAICVKDSAQSVGMLPLILYKLRKSSDSQLKLRLLYSLPNFATDKLTVGPILSTIQLLSCTPSLRPVSLRLMTELWRKEDRCFPHLMHMLNESSRSSAAEPQLHEQLLLARAACIRDVCCFRPSEHGEDMLSLLSQILNQCSKTDESPAVCLALQALTSLCQHQVIDLRTAWIALATKLNQDKRPLVLVHICRLLCLAADTQIETEDYKVFVLGVMEKLWQMTDDSDCRVSGAAYIALSHFSPHLILSHNPLIADSFKSEVSVADVKHLKRADDSRTSAEQNSESEDRSAMSGVLFVNMIKDVNVQVIKEYTEFLRALVRVEMETVPRSMRESREGWGEEGVRGCDVQNKGVASLSAVLHDLQQNNRDPALKSALAIGCLFTFEPLMTSRESQSRRVTSRCKEYQNMLEALVNDVIIVQSDLHQCQVKASAWQTFMNQCFNAFLDMRLNELKNSVKKENSEESLEENKILQHGAWLWARDKLTEIIKGLSRSSPSVQCNSVYALCGLASAVSNHVSTLEASVLKDCSTLSEHVGQGHWLKMVGETVLSIADPTYRPTGRLISLCGRKSSTNPDEAAPASVQARAGAVAGFALLAAPLAGVSFGILSEALGSLTSYLPGVTDDTVPDVIQTHAAVGLGATISALINDNSLDSLQTHESDVIWKAIHSLHGSAFSTAENRYGSIAGLSTSVAALCRDGKEKSKTEVIRTLDRFFQSLQSVSASNAALLEALAMGVASVSGSAFQANIISSDRLDEIMKLLQKLNEPLNVGVSRAIGIVLYVAQSSNHHQVRDWIRSQSNHWTSVATNQECVTSDTEAAVSGLVALIGSHQVISPMVTRDCGSNVLIELGVLNDVVRILKSYLSSTSADSRLRHLCCWLSGLLHCSTALCEQVRVNVANNYHHLAETSMLRALVDLLTDIPKSDTCKERVYAVLKCLDTAQSLPPLNWSSLLSPILRLSSGVEVEQQCVRVMTQRSADSQSAARLVSSLVTPPLFSSLYLSTRLRVLHDLSTFIKCMPHSSVSQMIDKVMKPLFTCAETDVSGSEDESEMRGAVVRAVRDCLAVSGSLGEDVRRSLWSALQHLYIYISTQITDADDDVWDLITVVCDSFALVPDSVLDNLISHSTDQCTTSSQIIVQLFIRCSLVGRGAQPLTWLNQSVEDLVSHSLIPPSSHDLCMRHVMCALLAVRESVENVKVKVDWLLELLGFCRVVLTSSHHDEQSTDSYLKCCRTVLLIVLWTVVCWAEPLSALLVSLHQMRKHDTDPSSSTDLTDSLCSSNKTSNTIKHMTSLFTRQEDLECLVYGLAPRAFSCLVTMEPWKQHAGKIMDWMLSVHDSLRKVQQTESMQSILIACLHSLRHCDVFKKSVVWTRVAML